MSRLSEIRARCDAATPGPWYYEKQIWDFIRDDYGRNVCLLYKADDIAFLSNARTDIPYLLAEIERLTKERNAIKQSCDGLCASHDSVYARLQEAIARAEQAERERDTYKAALENWHEGAEYE